MTYDHTTRVISGLVSGEIGSEYVGTPILFVIGGLTYFGTIESITLTTLTIVASTSLPTASGTVTAIEILDSVLTHNYLSYSDEVASLINDDAAKLAAADIKLILQKAATDWGKDEPLYVSKKITGDGTALYVLSTILSGLWKYGYSKIKNIEYPISENPATFMDQDAFRIYDDGTAQDGSNLKLMLVEDTPSATDYFIVHFSIEPLLNEVTINFPDTNETFSKITTLAAAYACQRLATVYAQSIDASISADVVNYNDKSSKYMTLAKQYFDLYNRLMFGDGNLKAAMAQRPLYFPSIESELEAANRYAFHRGRR
jgi:hypothetical protein